MSTSQQQEQSEPFADLYEITQDFLFSSNIESIINFDILCEEVCRRVGRTALVSEEVAWLKD